MKWQIVSENKKKVIKNEENHVHVMIFNELFPDDAGKYRVIISKGEKTKETTAVMTGIDSMALRFCTLQG